MILSIRLQCYNHGLFIEKALQSIIAQNTNFDFEVVIGDDFSTDNTLEIIKRVIKENTNTKITFNLLDRKQGELYSINRKAKGRLYNFYDILNNCQGRYIALLDGDDYWSDASKLQTQVDFLENNPDFAVIGHNARQVIDVEETEKLVRSTEQNYVDYLTSDLIQQNPFVTSIVMLRNIGFKECLSELNYFLVGDWPLFTRLSFKGKCRFYAKPMGFYRIHDNSITSKNRVDYKPFRNEFVNRINHATYWNAFGKNKFDIEERAVKERRSLVLTKMAMRNLDFKTAIKYAKFVNSKDVKKTYTKYVISVLKLLS
nr:glycosyltransferase [uncultured Psychroserpens sp.]